MKILIWDVTKERRTHLVTDISSMFKDINVIGEYTTDKAKCLSFIEPSALFDIYMIHLNNLSSSVEMDNFVSKITKPVIIYSGGVIDVIKRNQDEISIQQGENRFHFFNTNNICIVNHPVDTTGKNSFKDLNLESAFNKYLQTQNYREFLNIICNYDPALEAKLNLLHNCLVKNDKVKDIENYKSIQDIVVVTKEQIKTTVHKFLDDHFFDTDVHFDNLTRLRDALLNNA